MPADDRMEPLERLLNLVGLLLETRTPLTFERIRETLEPYRQERVDTAKRMFERDKDVLREYGIPLELVDIDAWGAEQGYTIPKEKYYLPEIEFTPEELAALFVAAQGGDGETPVARAIGKLIYGSDGGVLIGLGGGPMISGSDAAGQLVMAVADAAQAHRLLRFGYRNARGELSEREVSAWAVVYASGHWYLVGRDGTSGDPRAFRLSRFQSDPIDAGEGDAPPQGFRAADHVQRGPWSSRTEDRALIAIAPRIAWWAASLLRGAEEGRERDDGWIEVSVPMTDERDLASWVLQFGPDAEVIEPPSLVAEVVQRLEAVVG